MKKIVLWIVALMFLSPVAFIGYVIIHDKLTRVYTNIHYKTTVTIETPEGVKTGYAVRELSNSAVPGGKLFPEGVNSADIRGEAVVVDLGERGKVFALMKGFVSQADYAQMIMYWTFGGGTDVEGIKALNALPKGNSVTLKPNYYPIMVMFKDIDDQNSVTPVIEMENISTTARANFAVTKDRFRELFGEGVRLRSITMEITDEPVTEKIEQHLPWLPEVKAVFPPWDEIKDKRFYIFIPRDFHRDKIQR